MRPPVTPIDYFEEVCRHAVERPQAVVFQTIREGSREVVRFGEMMQGAREHSEELARAGVGRGDRVAIVMENDHHWVLALLGIAGVGAVAVPLDPAMSSGRLVETLSHAECRLLFASASFREHLESVRAGLPGLVVWERGGGTPEGKPADRLDAVGTWPLVTHDPEADFLLVYTGGTTGTPKGVRLSLRALWVAIQDTTKVFPLGPEDHILSILPLFHIMAIQASVLGPLYKGTRITYLISKEPKRILAAFAEEGITAFLCVPLFYYQIRRRILEEVERQSKGKRLVFGLLLKISRAMRQRFGWNLGRVFFRPIHRKFGEKLRGFGVGGAHFDPSVAASLHDLGFRFFQGYGMTETAALSALTPMGIDGGLSSGKALERAEIAIDQRDERGIGEIKIRGQHLMSGYWKEDRATAEVLRDGWLWTGDLGRMGEDGRLQVTGRKKDVIVLSSGKNVFPEPLEQHYQTHCPLIAEICICGISETGPGESLHGVIVPDFGELRRRGIVNVRDAILYQLQSAGKNLAAHERLHGFEISQEPLPRTSARKLLRYRIREGLERRVEPAAMAEVAPAADSMASEVIGIIRRMKSVRMVTAAMDLELDLGFDSLERVELLGNVQDRFRCTLGDREAQEILTVGQLVSAVERAGGRPAETSESTTGAQERAWSGILSDPLSEEEAQIARDYLGPRPVTVAVLFVLTRLFCLLAGWLLRFRFQAAGEFPRDRAFVIAANHQSHLDTPLLMGRVPYHVFQRICFLSTSRLHGNWFQAWFGRRARAIPIDPDRRLRSALRIAALALRRGKVLCVFPEGHRSMDGKLLPFRKGLAILAVDQKVGVVPVGIEGTGLVWGRGSSRIRLSPVSIRTGAMLAPQGESVEAFNRRLLEAVAELAGQPVSRETAAAESR